MPKTTTKPKRVRKPRRCLILQITPATESDLARLVVAYTQIDGVREWTKSDVVRDLIFRAAKTISENS